MRRCTASPRRFTGKRFEDRDALNEQLLQRGKQLDSAGYAPQVKVTSKKHVAFLHGRRTARFRSPRNNGNQISGRAAALDEGRIAERDRSGSAEISVPARCCAPWCRIICCPRLHMSEERRNFLLRAIGSGL